MSAPQDAATAAARFGQPVEWGEYHARTHVCVDGRNYYSSATSGCLVTDPEMEQTARYFMRTRETRA